VYASKRRERRFDLVPVTFSSLVVPMVHLYGAAVLPFPKSAPARSDVALVE
jgi:hypothetical protein